MRMIIEEALHQAIESHHWNIIRTFDTEQKSNRRKGVKHYHKQNHKSYWQDSPGQRSVDTRVYGLSASCPCPPFFEKFMSVSLSSDLRFWVMFISTRATWTDRPGRGHHRPSGDFDTFWSKKKFSLCERT